MSNTENKIKLYKYVGPYKIINICKFSLKLWSFFISYLFCSLFILLIKFSNWRKVSSIEFSSSV